MGADEFVEQAFAEIDEQQKTEILSNEKVISALRCKSSRIGTITYGEFSVKFRLSLSRKLRKELYASKTDENVERTLYKSLAAMCTEPPWNDWKTWVVYDENQSEDGVGALEIFQDMMLEVQKFNEGVEKFRPQ